MLTANREDIDESSIWNQTIRDSIPHAFILSVQQLNESPIRYTWPRYLPSEAGGTFFRELCVLPMHLRRTLAVLELEGGQLETPYDLRFVLKIYRDNLNAPLTLCGGTKGKYLLWKYSLNNWEYMKGMVPELSSVEFLEDLRIFMNDPNSGFYRKDENWHLYLADILLTLFWDKKDEITGLPLIPLWDGSWSCAKNIGGQIFFSGGVGVPAIPSGISALEVSPGVRDSSRLSLFGSLGVKPFSASAIQDLIVHAHEDMDHRSRLTECPLILHTRFLYYTGWTNRKDVELLVTTESRQLKAASMTYVDGHGQLSAAYFFRAKRDKFLFINPKYFKEVDGPLDRWKSWLQSELWMLLIPRLAEFSNSGKSFSISPEFSYIL